MKTELLRAYTQQVANLIGVSVKSCEGSKRRLYSVRIVEMYGFMDEDDLLLRYTFLQKWWDALWANREKQGLAELDEAKGDALRLCGSGTQYYNMLHSHLYYKNHFPSKADLMPLEQYYKELKEMTK